MAYVPRRALLMGAALAPLAAPSIPAWADRQPLSSGGSLIDIRDFGAVGDGRTDDTAAIEAAFGSAPAAAGSVYIPPGNYVYNGSGLDSAHHGSIEVIGDARFSSKISLGRSSFFINYSQYLDGLLVRDLTFVGGRGAIRHSYSGVNVQQKHLVQNCRFKDYTECAISTESIDMPYWIIQNCFFDAADTGRTIAVALGPGTDQCVIDSCSFIRNRVHIKARTGNNLHVANCDFIQFSDDNSAGPRVAVWIVPHPTAVNAGTGLTVTSSKFGNEGLMPGDFRLLYADEDAGESIGSRLPSLESDSTGFVRGHNITQNAFIGAGANSHPIIHSTTPNVWELQVHHNALAGGQPNSVIDFRTPPQSPDRLSGSSVFGPFTGPVGLDFVSFPASNAAGIAHLADPQALLERSDTVRNWPSGTSASFRELLAQPITAFSTASASTTNIADAYGGADAVKFTMMSDSGSLSCELPTPFTIGLPLWVEFDIASPGDDQAATQIFATVADSPAVYHWRRCVDVPSADRGWVTFAFCFFPRTPGLGPTRIVFQGTKPNEPGRSVKLGRPRVYQANERQLGGSRPLVVEAAETERDAVSVVNDIRDKLIGLGLFAGTRSSASPISGGDGLSTQFVPTHSDSPGRPGQIGWDATHLYICTGTNAWRRLPLADVTW